MNEVKNEKIFRRVKENTFLFVIRSIWSIFWYALGVTLCIGLGTLLTSGLSGIFCCDGKMNTGILDLGLRLIPLLIVIRIIHIILLRKNQFYIISARSVTSKGGFLTRFEKSLHMNEIQSVSYTQTLMQQLFGCGDLVISSAAASRGTMVLKNVDRVKLLYSIINENH